MKRSRTPKRTRTRKNKSIKGKRRLGGSKHSNLPLQILNDTRRNIGIHNNATQRPNEPKLPLQPSRLSPHTTTSTMQKSLPLGKLLGLAAVVSLGSIPGSHAFTPNQEAIKCVQYNGSWDSNKGQCTNKSTTPSTKSNSVIAATNCVTQGNSWTSGSIGHCHRFSALTPHSQKKKK